MQLAGSSLIQYIFGLVDKATAHSMMISPETAQVYFHKLVYGSLDEIRPLRIAHFPASDLNENGSIILPKQGEPSFRFTRNLRKVLGPLVRGNQFEATLTAGFVALSLERPLEVLRHHLQLYLRDDIVEWAQSYNKSADSSIPQAEKNAEVFIQRILAAKPTVGLNEVRPIEEPYPVYY